MEGFKDSTEQVGKSMRSELRIYFGSTLIGKHKFQNASLCTTEFTDDTPIQAWCKLTEQTEWYRMGSLLSRPSLMISGRFFLHQHTKHGIIMSWSRLWDYGEPIKDLNQ